MRAILLAQAEVTSIGARVDKSIRFSVVTGEIEDGARSEFFKLQGTNCRILITPQEEDDSPPVEVKGEIAQKTCGQRLRASLFVLWKQQGAAGDFEVAYKGYMEKFISSVKAKLEP